MKAILYKLFVVMALILMLIFVTDKAIMASDDFVERIGITEIFTDFPVPGQITIFGHGFGVDPQVTLGDFGPLEVIAATESEIIASLPELITDGDYAVSIMCKYPKMDKDIEKKKIKYDIVYSNYDLTIGAVGPSGPQGPEGPQGEPGECACDITRTEFEALLEKIKTLEEGLCPDNDQDGYRNELCGGGDCNDADSSIHPDAVEICDDGIDNDCDGNVDCSDSDCADSPACHCTDADNDGYYAQSGCGTAADCNDADSSIHPGAVEICDDGIDNDCDGNVDCSDSDCADSPACHCTDADNDGYYAQSGCGTAADCNDADSSIHPGAVEICDDGIDNDCDGNVDCSDSDCADSPACHCTDADNDGYYAQSGCGTAADCNDADSSIHPGAVEICDDGIDNDCDGSIDSNDTDCQQ